MHFFSIKEVYKKKGKRIGTMHFFSIE